MNRDWSRRAVLGGIGAVGLAGCTGEQEESVNGEADGFAPVTDEDASVQFEEVATENFEAELGVSFEMSAEGIEINPVGSAVEGEGYFVVIVNRDPIEEGEEIPFDDDVHHFQEGEREGEIESIDGLSEGEETRLVLQAADGDHRAYGLTDEVVLFEN